MNQIQFLQRQIRKYLSYKHNQSNKLFNRPPQNKSKNNYLFLNSTNENENLNDVETNNPNNNDNSKNSKNNSPNEKEIETQDDIEKIKPNQENESFLNNERNEICRKSSYSKCSIYW